MEMQTQTGEPVKIKNRFVPKNTEPLSETSVPLEDLPNVRLSSKQGEEIHTDEYSLKLFYATRICPMTLEEIKRRFPEPSPGKAQSVLNIYIDCELVHKTENGAYYSNYPDNYINYSDHKYDRNIEERKDTKIFETMKEHSGQKEYWETRSYFSIDSFFTPEQTKELQAMFKDIKYKAKQFVQKNARNKTLDGLKFRRIKFYDMILSVLFFVLVGTMPTQKALAGNDPTQPYKLSDFIQVDPMMIVNHDPLGGKIVEADSTSADNTFDVAFVESVLKDHFEMVSDQIDSDEKLLTVALIRECEESLIPGNNNSSSNWDRDCTELLTQAVIGECLNGNERACQELKSENLIVEI